MPPAGTAAALPMWPHTPTITRPTEKPAQSGVHRQPSRAQPGGKDEVAQSWAGVRLAWVTQGSVHLPGELQAVGGQRGKKGGATASWALASPHPVHSALPAPWAQRTVPRASGL